MARIVQWAFNCFSWPSIYPCASIFFWRSVAPRTPQATVYSFWCSTTCPLVLLFWLYLFLFHTASWAQREENAWELTMPSIRRKPLASGSGCRTLKACWDDVGLHLHPGTPLQGQAGATPGFHSWVTSSSSLSSLPTSFIYYHLVLLDYSSYYLFDVTRNTCTWFFSAFTCVFHSLSSLQQKFLKLLNTTAHTRSAFL